MFKQIRTLLAEDFVLEGSSVEMDETYMGGVRKFRAGRKLRGDIEQKKMPVFGMAERGGRIMAFATPNIKSATLFPIIRDYVLPKSTIFTDERSIYDGVGTMKNSYKHRRIMHKTRVYVRGNVHTNTIEGFWSLVKRGLSGVYHSVSQKHLQSYLDEYSFRYNRRDQGNLIFTSILKRASEQASQKPSLQGVQSQDA